MNKHQDKNKESSVLIVDTNFFSSVAMTGMFENYRVASHHALDSKQAFKKVTQRYNENRSTYKLILVDHRSDYDVVGRQRFNFAKKVKDFLREQDPSIALPKICELVDVKRSEDISLLTDESGYDIIHQKPVYQANVAHFIQTEGLK